ncbi:1-deoxy-D-xylulose-5-phosphate synthase [bacterium]|nr:1-deoxy-D-xylulose-5-phosphate synthase [bacterium]
MSILEKIESPKDLKLIRRELFPELAKEIREEIIKTVSVTGGHLAGSLGVVELSIALHYVFNLPQDKIIWDVGHQCYPHKLLTGRKKLFSTLRQFEGISGFPKREESVYDAFGVGHSSTSISAGLGFACARDIKGEESKVAVVIGDGAMTGGMVFEGLNNAGHIATDLLVILNDNEMFISHKIGAFAGYLAKLMTLGLVKKLEKKAYKLLKRISFWGINLVRIAKRFKVLLFPGMLFEEMGFAYFGPIDGHDMNQMIDILSKIKDLKGPILLHIITKKGKGYPPAEEKPTAFHGVSPFDITTGTKKKTNSKNKIPTYTEVFTSTMLTLAKENKDIVAITAAMTDGTGLNLFEKQFPDRFYDVGIAEQHAVTFAAGLAAEGLKPVCAIYSTFLQRSFDQIIHDVCLQKLPVVFALDRGGIVGDDGPTHQGVFDLSYLRMIPNLIVMAPKDENELQHMLHTAFSFDLPCAIRFPRGKGEGVKMDSQLKALSLSEAEILTLGNQINILAIGNMVYPSLLAAQKLQVEEGISCGIVNMRFLKPLDKKTLDLIAKKSKLIVTVEENVLSGGFGSAISEFFNGEKMFIKSIGLPDVFIEQGKCEIIRRKYGLTMEKIAQEVKNFYKKHKKNG